MIAQRKQFRPIGRKQRRARRSPDRSLYSLKLRKTPGLSPYRVRTSILRYYTRGFSLVTGRPVLKYCQITPHLFVGDQYRRPGKRKLARLGINGTVNMRIEFDDAAHGLCLAYHAHLPTIDDTAPALGDLKKGVAFIEDVVAQGGKIYIHCRGGLGRAPTMAAAYLISCGHELDEALTLIRKVRPFISLQPEQLEQLERFKADRRSLSVH